MLMGLVLMVQMVVMLLLLSPLPARLLERVPAVGQLPRLPHVVLLLGAAAALRRATSPR